MPTSSATATPTRSPSTSRAPTITEPGVSRAQVSNSRTGRARTSSSSPSTARLCLPIPMSISKERAGTTRSIWAAISITRASSMEKADITPSRSRRITREIWIRYRTSSSSISPQASATKSSRAAALHRPDRPSPSMPQRSARATRSNSSRTTTPPENTSSTAAPAPTILR